MQLEADIVVQTHGEEGMYWVCGNGKKRKEEMQSGHRKMKGA